MLAKVLLTEGVTLWLASCGRRSAILWTQLNHSAQEPIQSQPHDVLKVNGNSKIEEEAGNDQNKLQWDNRVQMTLSRFALKNDKLGTDVSLTRTRVALVVQ